MTDLARTANQQKQLVAHSISLSILKFYCFTINFFKKLLNLKKHLIVLKTDKGNCLVILKHANYILKVKPYFNTNTYIRILRKNYANRVTNAEVLRGLGKEKIVLIFLIL